MSQLKDRIEHELKKGILDYWMHFAIDKKNGGFYGSISNSNQPEIDADKALIQNARNLWSYARAYNHFKDTQYLDIALLAKDYLINNLWDKEYGGFFWLVTSDGKPKNRRKQIYGQAFAIYALSEYFIATGDNIALDYAKRTFNLIEEHSLDKINNGYIEALSEDWKVIEDIRLSEVDMNEPKSNNTHLHIMEAYTTFAKVTDDSLVINRLKNSIDLMLDKIMDKNTLNFTLFFDNEWNKKSNIISYGHEIEGSWLIYEALLATKDQSFINERLKYVTDIAENCYKNYLDGDFGINGMFNEEDETGHIDKDKIWWVQAEACVGFYVAYELTGKDYFLHTVKNIWKFIEDYVVDKENGEWLWYGTDKTTTSFNNYKVQSWKSLYHNGRACIELIERISK